MKWLVATVLLLTSPASSSAQAQDDVKQMPACTYCGMDRDKFGQSRMTIEYDDGTVVGLCSLHCAAVDLALRIDKTPRVIRVADFGTRKLTDAEKAVWVLGGSKPGVMSRRAKWAFADRASAEAFTREHGGTLATFDEAVKSAYEDLYQDTNMIREKRKAKRAGATPVPASDSEHGHGHGH